MTIARITWKLAIGLVVLTFGAIDGAKPASATSSFQAEMMCYGQDRLLITTPMVEYEDGYRDLAVPEVFRYTSGGWRSFLGNVAYNDDVPVSGGSNTIGGSHTYPGVFWADAVTHTALERWDYRIATGTYVAVKMWVLDGRTAAWTWSWATNVGDLGGRGTVCRAGQYQGYGWR